MIDSDIELGTIGPMGIWGNFSKIIFTLFFAIGLVSCQGGSGSSGPAADGNNGEQNKPEPSSAEGVLFGQAWKYQSGRADYVSRSGKKFWVVTLYSQAFANPCTEVDGSDQQIRIQFRDVGSWAIDPNDPFVRVPSVVFVDFNRQSFFTGNVVANSGVISARLTNIGNNQILNGYVYAAFRPSSVGETQVTGSFGVPVCTRAQ